MGLFLEGERDVALHGWHVANGDAIRDGRILLLGERDIAATVSTTLWNKSFRAKLGIYDLATDEIRKLDNATGDWSMFTAMPHPYVYVRWTTEAELTSQPPTFGTGWDCMTYVNEESEEVRALGCTTTVLNATNMP